MKEKLYTWLSVLLSDLVPNADETATCLKAFFWGATMAFVFISSSDFFEDKKKGLVRTIKNGTWDKLAYSFLGGLCAMLIQAASGFDKVFIMQSLTIGAAWPYVARKLTSKNTLARFIESEEDVPVNEVGND